jgi:hypothetical protein
MNTKASKPRTKLHTDIITTRIAPEIKTKFETLCRAEYNTPSYVIRDFILEYVRNRTASLTTLATQSKPKPRQAHEYDLSQPTAPRPPSAQDWNDWGDTE